jgi:hypothetical protein
MEAKTPSICLQPSEVAAFKAQITLFPYLNQNFPGVF